MIFLKKGYVGHLLISKYIYNKPCDGVVAYRSFGFRVKYRLESLILIFNLFLNYKLLSYSKGRKPNNKNLSLIKVFGDFPSYDKINSGHVTK